LVAASCWGEWAEVIGEREIEGFGVDGRSEAIGGGVGVPSARAKAGGKLPAESASSWLVRAAAGSRSVRWE
jgi:hypothetical protein